MPPKPDNELTQVESSFLATAARLLAAVKRVSESPSTGAQLAHYNAMVFKELVSLQTSSHVDHGANISHKQTSVDTQYNNFTAGSKTPRLHPILQLMAEEWHRAKTAETDPNWGLFTKAYLTTFCDRVATEHPGWHKDLRALDLSSYIGSSFDKKAPWWIPDQEAGQEAGDGASHPLYNLQAHSHRICSRYARCTTPIIP
jgi:hypothetical protein